MKKLRNIILFSFITFCFFNQSVQSDTVSYDVMENIKNIGEFLKSQEYFEQVSHICHEEECFSIDIHDLNRSIVVVENKIVQKIKDTYGEDKALEAKLKGLSITKVLTR